MKKNKHLKHILLGISLWFSAWTVTQGIFMSEILFKLPIDVNISYLITTILILVITIISLYIYPRHRKEALSTSPFNEHLVSFLEPGGVSRWAHS